MKCEPLEAGENQVQVQRLLFKYFKETGVHTGYNTKPQRHDVTHSDTAHGGMHPQLWFVVH